MDRQQPPLFITNRATSGMHQLIPGLERIPRGLHVVMENEDPRQAWPLGQVAGNGGQFTASSIRMASQLAGVSIKLGNSPNTNGFPPIWTSYFCAMESRLDPALKSLNLLKIKAVRLSPSKPFTWASSSKSPIYCDNRKTLGHPSSTTSASSSAN